MQRVEKTTAEKTTLRKPALFYKEVSYHFVPHFFWLIPGRSSQSEEIPERTDLS